MKLRHTELCRVKHLTPEQATILLCHHPDVDPHIDSYDIPFCEHYNLYDLIDGKY